MATLAFTPGPRRQAKPVAPKPIAAKPIAAKTPLLPSTDNDDYSYPDLLLRLYQQTGGAKVPHKFILLAPQVSLAPTQTCVANYRAICEQAQLNPVYLNLFFQTETCSTVRVVEGKLLIKGRFRSSHVERIFRRYAQEYMCCPACRGFNTTLALQQRLLTMTCQDCAAATVVQNIKAGYAAKTRYN